MGRNVEGKIKGQLCKWVKDLLQTREIKVSRCLYEVSESVTVLFSIHGFGDASKRVSCAMAYLVNCMDDGQAHASLVVSKTRVAPLKQLSIPCLELMSARILAQLMNTVCNALQSQVKVDGVRF